MNMTMYPSLFGKLLPAIWGYMLAQAGSPVADKNVTANITNFTAKITSVPILEKNEMVNMFNDYEEEEVPRENDNEYMDDEELLLIEEQMQQLDDLEYDYSVDAEDLKFEPIGYDQDEYDHYYSAYEYEGPGPLWYGYVMERVYGINMNDSFFPEKEVIKNMPTSEATAEFIRQGVQANMRIRDQICSAGMIIMSISSLLCTFCILISCCSGSNARKVVNASLKEPLLKLHELDKKVNDHMPPPTAPPPPVTRNSNTTSHSNQQPVLAGGVATGQVVEETSKGNKGAPCESPESQATLSYV